ncbi:MAG: serine/threonine-protein kinase [Chloroflexota bacterium]
MQGTDPLIGQTIDGYDIQSLLGHGGMGRVYQALDITLNRYAALKVMSHPTHKAELYKKRFDREAQSIAKLKHPNIVAIYRFNRTDDFSYMAMEFVDGADLRWVLRDYASNGELIDYKTLYDIINQIAKALDYAHKNGVIHRDIKPSNIMIARDGAAILTDFGLALDTNEGTLGEAFGSPHYIAPEQAVNSAKAVPQTDIYSLGVVLYEKSSVRLKR